MHWRIITHTKGGVIVLIIGWVKTIRKQKALSFVNVCDGSDLSGIQVVIENTSGVETGDIKTGKTGGMWGGLVYSYFTYMEMDGMLTFPAHAPLFPLRTNWKHQVLV